MESLGIFGQDKRWRTQDVHPMVHRGRTPNHMKSENSMLRQQRRIHLRSIHQVPVRKTDSTPIANELDDSRASHNYATTGQAEDGVLGRGIANYNAHHQPVPIHGHQTASATDTLIQTNTEVWPTMYFWMRGVCVCYKGKTRKTGTLTLKCIFLGYGTNGTSGYWLWDLEQ